MKFHIEHDRDMSLRAYEVRAYDTVNGEDKVIAAYVPDKSLESTGRTIEEFIERVLRPIFMRAFRAEKAKCSPRSPRFAFQGSIAY